MRSLILIWLGIVLAPTAGLADVAVDAVSNGVAQYTSPVTWSHTVSGANRLLVVGVMATGSGSTSSCTYNSVSMTSLGHVNLHGTYDAELFVLVAPDTGTHTVSCTAGNNFTINAGAVSLTGVDQTTPYGTAQTAKDTGTASSVTVTSATGGLVVDVAGTITSGTMTADASQTQEWEASADGSTLRVGQSVKAGATSVTMQWSWADSEQWAALAVPVNAAAGGGGGGAVRHRSGIL